MEMGWGGMRCRSGREWSVEGVGWGRGMLGWGVGLRDVMRYKTL